MAKRIAGDRFSRSRFPDNADSLPRLNIEGNPVDRPDYAIAGIEAGPEISDFEERHGGSGSFKFKVLSFKVGTGNLPTDDTAFTHVEGRKMEDGFAGERIGLCGEPGPLALDDGVGPVTVRHFDFIKSVRFVDLNDSTDGFDGGALSHGHFTLPPHGLELFQLPDKPRVGGLDALDALDNRLAFGKQTSDREGHGNAVIPQ